MCRTQKSFIALMALVGLSTWLALLPCNCVVHMITSFIIVLCLLNLRQLILWDAGNHLLFLVTLNPCTNMSICLHIQFPTGTSGSIKFCRLQGGHLFFGTYGASWSPLLWDIWCIMFLRSTAQDNECYQLGNQYACLHEESNVTKNEPYTLWHP